MCLESDLRMPPGEPQALLLLAFFIKREVSGRACEDKAGFDKALSPWMPGMAANGEGLQMMLTSFFAMNGGPGAASSHVLDLATLFDNHMTPRFQYEAFLGSWQQPPWIPEAPQPEQEQGGDIIQKLINKEIPMPQALSAAQVEKPQVGQGHAT